MSDTDAMDFTLEELQKVHPEASRYFEVGAVVKWDAEPGLRSCQAHFEPGQMHEVFPLIARAEGRIIFAGDRVGGAPGYTFSALLSGRRAAADLLAVA